MGQCWSNFGCAVLLQAHVYRCPAVYHALLQYDMFIAVQETQPSGPAQSAKEADDGLQTLAHSLKKQSNAGETVNTYRHHAWQLSLQPLLLQIPQTSFTYCTLKLRHSLLAAYVQTFLSDIMLEHTTPCALHLESCPELILVSNSKE